jgi:hypothetical protein
MVFKTSTAARTGLASLLTVLVTWHLCPRSHEHSPAGSPSHIEQPEHRPLATATFDGNGGNGGRVGQLNATLESVTVQATGATGSAAHTERPGFQPPDVASAENGSDGSKTVALTGVEATTHIGNIARG